MLYTACAQAIDRLALVHASGGGKRLANSFRLGAVWSISECIKEEQQALRDELRGTVSDTALVVVQTKSDRAKEDTENMGKAPLARPNLVDSVAYHMGAIHGEKVYREAKTDKITEG
jgi:hypothetical protein